MPFYNLGHNKKEQLTPFPQSKEKMRHLGIIEMREGWSRCFIYFVVSEKFQKYFDIERFVCLTTERMKTLRGGL